MRHPLLLVCWAIACRVVLASWPLPATSVCSSTCQSAQRDAILQLSNSTAGERWTRPVTAIDGSVLASTALGGIVPADLPQHCLWQGVSCCLPAGYVLTAAGRDTGLVPCDIAYAVVALQYATNNMSGQLPDGCWNALASSLTRLALPYNWLTGPLTPMMALPNLQYLDIAGNLLSGSVATTLLSALPQLVMLKLESNQLTGQVPSLSMLRQLEGIWLRDNGFDGAIPKDWLSTTSLRTVDFSFNRLNGTIPGPQVPADANGPFNVELSLYINDNQLTGLLPPSLLAFPLQVFNIGNNSNLQWPVNATFAMARFVYFSHNTLSTTLPSVSDTVSVRSELVDIMNNRVAGSWPSIRASNLRQLFLNNNPLTGALPSIMETPRLQVFTMLNTDQQQSIPNSRGELLPEYFKFGSLSSPSYDVSELNCLSIEAIPSYMPNLYLIAMDGFYHNFQGCKCNGALELVRNASTGRGHCQPGNKVSLALALPVAICGALVVALLVLLVWTWFVLNKEQLLKSHGPPGKDQRMVMVWTDVEGSTELWEWNNNIMMESIDIHDRIIRADLSSKYHGYECGTEGDAFTLCFHDPVDALAWCLSTQHALLTADWPAELDSYPATAVSYRPDVEGSDEVLGATLGSSATPSLTNSPTLTRQALTPPPADASKVLFRGLRVRMSVVTGVCEDVKMNKTSKTMAYTGKVTQLSRALAGAPHGGQILLEESTMTAVKGRLAELCSRVTCKSAKNFANNDRFACHSPDRGSTDSKHRPVSLEVLRVESMRRSNMSSRDRMLNTMRAEAPPGASGPESPVSSPSSSPTRQMDPLAASQEVLLAASSPSPRVSAERSRPAQNSGSLPSPRRTCKQQLQVAAHHTRSWIVRALTRSRFRPEKGAQRCIMVDMGEHMLAGLAGTHCVLQMLIPSLEDRAWILPPICTQVQVHAGFFEAPGALACPPCLPPWEVLPRATLVFSAVDGITAMQAANAAATELMLTHYRDCIRSCLNTSAGYECQEAEGDFMLAFADPVKAVLFCVMVQNELMQGMWSREELALPNCQPEIGPDGNLLWCGPRVKLGMFQGFPTKIVPHATSGRADYFGSLVNRAARYCHSGAHGGQVMVPLDIAQEFVRSCTGTELSLEEDAPSHFLGPTGPCPPPVPVARQLSGIQDLPQGNPYRKGSTGRMSVEGQRPLARKSSIAALYGGQSWVTAAGMAAQQAPGVRFTPHASRSCQELPKLLKQPVQAGPLGARAHLSSRELPQLAAPIAAHHHARASSAGSEPRRGSNLGPANSRTSIEGPKMSLERSLEMLRRTASPLEAAFTQGGDAVRWEENALARPNQGTTGEFSRLATQSSNADSPGWVHIVHCGYWRLKGVHTDLAALQILPASLAGRKFPEQTSSKAKQVAPAKGLQVVCQLPRLEFQPALQQVKSESFEMQDI